MGELRSVPAPAPPVTTTPLGTATPAAAVAAGPEQVFSPLVGERLSTQLSQELNLAQAKGLYKAVVAGSGDSFSWRYCLLDHYVSQLLSHYSIGHPRSMRFHVKSLTCKQYRRQSSSQEEQKKAISSHCEISPVLS